jgi:hypothetical protein
MRHRPWSSSASVPWPGGARQVPRGLEHTNAGGITGGRCSRSTWRTGQATSRGPRTSSFPARHRAVRPPPPSTSDARPDGTTDNGTSHHGATASTRAVRHPPPSTWERGARLHDARTFAFSPFHVERAFRCLQRSATSSAVMPTPSTRTARRHPAATWNRRSHAVTAWQARGSCHRHEGAAPFHVERAAACPPRPPAAGIRSTR